MIQEAHDIRRYFIYTPSLDIAPTGILIVLPVPISGRVTKLVACCEVSPNVNTTMTFQHAGVDLAFSAGSATVTLQSGDIVGDIQEGFFSEAAGANYLLEGQDGDAFAAGGSISIVSDGSAVSGDYRFVFHVQP